MDNAKEKVSILYYKEWASLAMEMPEEMRLSIFDALNNYIINKEMPPKSSPCYWVFVGWANQLKRDEEKYLALCEKNSANGKKGGRPRKPNITQKSEGFLEKPKKADKEEDYDNDNEEENENKKDIDINPSLSRFFSLFPNLKTTFKNPNSITMEQFENIVLGMDRNIPWSPISKDNKESYNSRAETLNNKLREMNNYTFPHQPISIYDTLVSWLKRDIKFS